MMQLETMAATLQKQSNVAQSLRCQWQHPLPRQSPVVLLLPSQKTCGILPPRSGGKEHRRLKTITLQSRRKFSVSLVFYCVGFVSNIYWVSHEEVQASDSLILLPIWLQTHRLLTKNCKIDLWHIFSFCEYSETKWLLRETWVVFDTRSNRVSYNYDLSAFTKFAKSLSPGRPTLCSTPSNHSIWPAELCIGTFQDSIS